MAQQFARLELVDGLSLPYGIEDSALATAVVCRREVWRPRALLRRILADVGPHPWVTYDTAIQEQRLLDLPAPDHPWLYERFEGRLLDLNERHFGLALSYWQPMRLTRYPAGSRGHESHTDYGAPEPAKLAFSVLLARPDRGGEIRVHSHGPALALWPGDMVVFPAYEPHSVSAVDAGERIALTGWLGGPPLR